MGIKMIKGYCENKAIVAEYYDLFASRTARRWHYAGELISTAFDVITQLCVYIPFTFLRALIISMHVFVFPLALVIAWIAVRQTARVFCTYLNMGVTPVYANSTGLGFAIQTYVQDLSGPCNDYIDIGDHRSLTLLRSLNLM